MVFELFCFFSTLIPREVHKLSTCTSDPLRFQTRKGLCQYSGDEIRQKHIVANRVMVKNVGSTCNI